MNIIKKTSDDDVMPDLAALRADIATLKQDLAVAMEHLKTGAVATGTRTAAEQMTDKAADLFDDLSAQGGRAAKSLSGQIEQQPIMSVLIAFSVGYLISRFASR